MIERPHQPRPRRPAGEATTQAATRRCAIRQRAAPALALAAALLLAPAGPANAPAAQAKGKFQTVTRTFANGATVDIPATETSAKANPYPLTVSVSGFQSGKITDVDLTLRDFSFGIPSDVDMLLVAPNGKNAIFFSDAGDGSSVEHLTITLDDEAADPLPGDPLISGRFRPTNFEPAADPFPDAPAPSGDVALSTFDGGDPNGEWRLFIVDDNPGDTGTLGNGYELTITAKVKKTKRGGRRRRGSGAITANAGPGSTRTRVSPEARHPEGSAYPWSSTSSLSRSPR